MTADNVLAYFAQVALLVAVCAALPRLLALRSATVQHVFWRTLLAACLLLPLVQPRLPHEMVFVPAPAGSAAAAPPAASSPAGAPARPPSIDWILAAEIVIAGGIAARLAWMSVGLLRLRRLRRGAVEPALGFDDLLDAIGLEDVPILWSRDAAHPVTFGVRRPVVLLPAAIKAVDRAAQRAVVAHELHHVKRRDWPWTVGEEILRSTFWFHPAMWWLISRVQLARETVVDELSILTTNERRAYLDTLLAFADDSGPLNTAPSPAFSARRHLFHRVMLLSKEGGMSSTRIAAASCALAVALTAGAWTAVSAFPLYSNDTAPAPADQQKPPRDPLSPDTYHQLAVEYWEKAYRDLSLTPEMRLDLVLKGIAAEDRALAINPDYVPALTYKNILLRMQANLTADGAQQARLIAAANEIRQRAVALLPPPPPPRPASGGGVPGGVLGGIPDGVPLGMVFMPASFERAMRDLNPVRVGPNVRLPAKVKDVKPLYPAIAQSAKVQGVVIVEVIIDETGRVAEARVLRSIPLLDHAALDAVYQWEFTPTKLNGMPQAVVMTVTVNFVLQ